MYFKLGIPEAAITWGHQDRSLTNGTIILNIWDTDFFQVIWILNDEWSTLNFGSIQNTCF